MLVCDGVGGAAAKTECAAIASSFFISVFSQPEKWVGKNSLFLWGCVALSKVHFIYKSKSGHCISPQHRHTVLTHANTHSCTTECPLSLSDSHRNTPFLSLPLILTHTHTHTRPLSVFEQYMQCPETELHAQLMSLLSRWLTLPDSHSQTLPKFHSPPASPSVLSSLLGFR